ncbi:MAG: crossover junction endodeoxyribonuclease RuvC [Myxococcales bacterium]|nr:crossover junction endodeoxyribonuclease RuvC [Myxococcales bacterium]
MSRERILGIDPGSNITGWGVVEQIQGRLLHIDNGGIFTRSQGFQERLKEIYDGLCDVIREYEPTCVALENVFVSKNAMSALKLGQARGVAMIASLNAGLSVMEFTPMQIKLAVTGHGHAKKDQVGLMVQAVLGLPEPAQVDASDALAAAITGLLQRPEVSPAAALLAEAQAATKGKRRRPKKIPALG